MAHQMVQQEIVSAYINFAVISSLFLVSCNPQIQNPTVKVDPTEMKPGETLVMPELTATVEPTEVVEPIMRFKNSELPAEFLSGLQKYCQDVPAWSNKEADEFEFDYFIFSKQDKSYQESSILVTVDGLSFQLARTAKSSENLEDILADAEIKPLLFTTNPEGQLTYFTQSINAEGEVENQVLMEGLVNNGELLTIAYLLDGTTVESKVDLVSPYASKAKIAAIDSLPDYLVGEINFDSQTGELTATNIDGGLVFWDGESQKWLSLAEKNKVFMDELEAQLTEEYGPSVENAESPVQTYTIEGPDGEPMEIIGQRSGLAIVGVTPKLKLMDVLSVYGYAHDDLDSPNKKAGEVLRVFGTDEDIEISRYIGPFVHLFAADNMDGSIFTGSEDWQWQAGLTDWRELMISKEYSRFVDWVAKNPGGHYSLDIDRHVYKDSGYIKEMETLMVDPTKPIIMIEDIPWHDLGRNNSDREKNSGAVVIDSLRFAAATWVTSKGELVMRVHHIDPSKVFTYQYLSPGDISLQILAGAVYTSDLTTPPWKFLKLMGQGDQLVFRYSSS